MTDNCPDCITMNQIYKCYNTTYVSDGVMGECYYWSFFGFECGNCHDICSVCDIHVKSIKKHDKDIKHLENMKIFKKELCNDCKKTPQKYL